MGDETGRAQELQRKREREQEEAEFRRRRIANELRVNALDNKVTAKYDAIEERIRNDTIGLLTLEQMRAKREKAEREHDMEMATAAKTVPIKLAGGQSPSQQPRWKPKISDKCKLSFADFEDEDASKDGDRNTVATKSEAPEDNIDRSDGESGRSAEEFDVKTVKKKRLGMDPSIDTSFLPDREREAAETQLRLELARQWREKQEAIKNEDIEIVYSYWDGSGHRRHCTVKKGFTILQFIQRAVEALRSEFGELKVCTVDQLMYIKEDLILPHHYTFYEFIVSKARGKSGPLFDFSVTNDVRLRHDATIETVEAHAGKVCLRSWYERNKHIFPASRWEPYDPEKKWDKYTVKDKNKEMKSLTGSSAAQGSDVS